MTALITGASGFVGRHLRTHLEEQGQRVVGLDREHGPDGDGVDIGDAPALRRAMTDARPDAVYHLAGWSDVGSSWRDPVAVLRANAEGTLNVLTAARDAGVGRVLVVTSAEVYGIVDESELPLTETSPLRPASPYAASKVAADYLAVQAVLGHGMDVVRARAFNHIGPGQNPAFVAPSIAARIAENEVSGGDEVPVGNLSARRDFTDVRDVVRAYRLAMESGERGEVYNVCSGRAIAVQELADLLLGMARRPMQLVADPERKRPVDTPVLLGSAARLEAATGWRPEIPIERSLSDVLDEFRARQTAT